MTKKNRLPRLNGPVIADTWRTMASLYGDQEKHVLPAPENAPSATAFDSGIGELSLSSTSYKVTYCQIDPETGEVLAESSPSPASNAVTVVNGRTAIMLPKRTDRIINAYRIYRLTSFRTSLTRSLSKTLVQSTDDSIKSTYAIGNTTVTLSPSLTRQSEYRRGSNTYFYEENVLSPFVGFFYFFGVSSNFRLILSFPTNDIISNATINSVAFQTFIKHSVISPSLIDVDIWAYNGDPLYDPLIEDSPKSMYLRCALATGGRQYLNNSTTFRPIQGEVEKLVEVNIGSSSTSQSCIDLGLAKSQGKKFTIALKDNEDSHDVANLINSKLKVTFNTPAVGFTNSDKKLMMGYLSDSSIRFQNLALPNSVTIRSARIVFTAWSDVLNSSNGTKIKIRGEASDNATTFTTDPFSRAKTSAEVLWNPTESWVPESKYSSPDISNVIQEIVNRVGWASGNSIALYLQDNGSSPNALRLANSFDNGLASSYPVLEINYADSNEIGTMYRLVDTVPSENSRLYIDTIADNVLNNNAEIPFSSSTDLSLSNQQNLFFPGNNLGDELARIVITEKGPYTTPINKILFITNLSSGPKYPITLGSDSPFTFKMWRSEGRNGYLICSLPIPVPPGTRLKGMDGSGEIHILGYFVDYSSSSNLEVFWKYITTTDPYTVDKTSLLLGGFSDGATQQQVIVKEGSSNIIMMNVTQVKYPDPNKELADGVYALSSLTMPIGLKEGHSLTVTTGAAYVWGVKYKTDG